MSVYSFAVKTAIVASSMAVLAGCSMNSYPATTASSMATFSGKMSAANEVPVNTSAAGGMAEAKFNKETRVLSYTVSYSGLTGPATAGHIHGPALAGANAGVAVPFSTSLVSPISGQATLTEAQSQDLMAGKYYVNIHTLSNPGGEIRGQLTPGM